MDILPRSNLSSYIEGNPAAEKPESTPYINLTTHVESNWQTTPQSLDLLEKFKSLLTSTFNKSNGGLGEYSGLNASIMSGNWQTRPSLSPKPFRSCKP